MSASVLFPLVVLLGAMSVVVAAIAYFRGEKESPVLQQRLLPRFYVYAMLFVALLVFFVGGGLLLKAGFSYLAGQPFSYRGEAVYAQAEPRTVPAGPPKVERVEYREEERVRDWLSGAAFALAGLLFFGLHLPLRRRLESQEEQRLSFLNKGYLMVSAVVYGGVALVLIPLALYQVAEFIVSTLPGPEAYWRRPVPGEFLGFALVALALWLWVLPQLLRAFGDQRGD